MTIKKSTWALFSLLAFVSILIWARFSYPQLAFTSFTVDRAQARTIARNYLTQELHVDLKPYHEAIVFNADEDTNRFLQRALGFDGLIRFLKKEDYELFYWTVRFFQEGKDEQYQVFVSSATGEIIALRHPVADTYPIERVEREAAHERAVAFLHERFGFNPDEYIVMGDMKNNYDNRTDYSFSWRKKSVEINWSDQPDAGFGKLVTVVRISGDQVLRFSKSGFVVPDKFSNEIARLSNTGNNLSTILRVLNFLLFFSTVYVITVRRNHLAMHTTKRFYIWLAVSFFVLIAGNVGNQLQSILFEYQSSVPLIDYLMRNAIDGIFYGLFTSIMILMPSLAAELLHFEQLGEQKKGAFLHYLRTSFFSRDLAGSIGIGYLTCLIMLGMQAILIEIGQRYWGVWREFNWMTQLTSAYMPLLAGFVLAYKSSFMEELLFRVFAISLGKKFFKNTLAAAIVASLLWGFGHSGYAVYPMWFRGVEVTMLGFLLSWVYLRFGIIPVLVAHYLFDIFWGAAAYLLGQTTPTYFLNTLILLLLPSVLAIVAFVMDRKPEERPLKWLFNKHQDYNLNILKDHLRTHWDHFGRLDRAVAQQEIVSHYWDLAVVETALEELYKEKGKSP